MEGEELMEMSPPPCDLTMGFCAEEFKEGYSRWTWTIRDDRFNNPIGRVLGGFIAVFADEPARERPERSTLSRGIILASAERRFAHKGDDWA